LHDPVAALQFPREQVEVKPGPVNPVLHGVVHLAPEVRLLQDHVSAVAGWLEGTPVQSVGGITSYGDITSYTPVASAHKVMSFITCMHGPHTQTKSLDGDSGCMTGAISLFSHCCLAGAPSACCY